MKKKRREKAVYVIVKKYSKNSNIMWGEWLIPSDQLHILAFASAMAEPNYMSRLYSDANKKKILPRRSSLWYGGIHGSWQGCPNSIVPDVVAHIESIHKRFYALLQANKYAVIGRYNPNQTIYQKQCPRCDAVGIAVPANRISGITEKLSCGWSNGHVDICDVKDFENPLFGCGHDAPKEATP